MSQSDESVVALKPCPFCGGRAETRDEVIVSPIYDPKTGERVGSEALHYENTGCPECGIWFELDDDEHSEHTTCELWNRRA